MMKPSVLDHRGADDVGRDRAEGSENVLDFFFDAHFHLPLFPPVPAPSCIFQKAARLVSVSCAAQ